MVDLPGKDVDIDERILNEYKQGMPTGYANLGG